jgi:hypothetical protein
MAPRKQVSPAIRILRGERDASARATHLEAATRKFLVTTNERKQMSSKTNFKRIALVAVAALGLGVLSSVPSQAIGSAHTITVTPGTQVIDGAIVDESATATKVVFTFIANTAIAGDTYSLSALLKSAPANNVSLPLLLLDTYTANTRVDTDGVSNSDTATTYLTQGAQRTATTLYIRNQADGSSTPVLVSATFRVMMPAGAAAGTYVATLYSDPSVTGSSDNVPALGTDVTFTVTQPTRAAASTRSEAFLSLGGASGSSSQAVDSAVSVVSTASGTAEKAVLRVELKGAADTSDAYTAESVTVTIDKGTVGDLTNSIGRSVVFAYTPGASSFLDVGIYSDGTAGTATITAKSTSTSFTKTVTFYSATAAKVTAAAYEAIVGTSTAAILGSEFDALDNNMAAGTDLYAYSSDTAVVSNYGTACGTYNSTLKGALCTLTGVKSGTAKITLRDAATIADSTVSSNAVDVTVNLNTAASISMKWDKATYAPGERAVILIQVLDSAGKSLPSGAKLNAISTTAGISSATYALTASSGSLAGGDVTTAVNAAASATSPVVTNAPHYQVVVTMPNSGGSIKITAKGGSGLPTAGQVEVSATATITDNAAAALAAVTALATTVAALKTLITTLTNLVLKIQKKVKA